MRVDWCVSSWFRIKNTHSHTRGQCAMMIESVAQPRQRPRRANPERSATADAAPLHTSLFTGRPWHLFGALARHAKR